MIHIWIGIYSVYSINTREWKTFMDLEKYEKTFSSNILYMYVNIESMQQIQEYKKKNKKWNSHFNIEFSVIRYFPTIHLWIDRIKYKENKKNYSSHFFEGNLDTWYIEIECNICNRSIRLFYSYQFIHSQSDCMSVDLLVIIMAFTWFIFHLFVFIVSERKKMLKFLQ